MHIFVIWINCRLQGSLNSSSSEEVARKASNETSRPSRMRHRILEEPLAARQISVISPELSWIFTASKVAVSNFLRYALSVSM